MKFLVTYLNPSTLLIRPPPPPAPMHEGPHASSNLLGKLIKGLYTFRAYIYRGNFPEKLSERDTVFIMPLSMYSKQVFMVRTCPRINIKRVYER